MKINCFVVGLLLLTAQGAYSQLTIFKDANQGGLSGSCVQNTIYSGISIPQNLNNDVSSILLQQGYIATLAENEDGTGSAYTFIAAISNVTVNLSSLLNEKVSFIRVLPLRNTLKKGVGNTNNAWINLLNVSWFYDWGSSDVGLLSREYAIMAWGRGSANNQTSINNYIAKTDVTHLLSFNEPDNTDQSNIGSSEAVSLHKNLAATGYRLGSPAPTEGQATQWLSDFMSEASYENVKVDYIAVHWYDWGSYSSTNNPAPDPNGVFTRFKNYINNIYAIYKKPIWITEFNANRNTTSATHEAFIALALPWLEAQDFVERYAYFFPPALPPVDGGGNVTPIGTVYKNHVSSAAIIRNWDNTENFGVDSSAAYEAENATLIGSSITNCVRASNGQMAGAVTGSNKIIFHNVTVNNAGNYTLDIDYYSVSARTLTIKVNGNPTEVVNIPASGAWCYQSGHPGTFQMTIPLNAGQNSIQLTESPIIDKIAIALQGAPLPVNLTDFYAGVKDKGIELNWSTAQENNNHYFELLRSKDGINFESITKVNSLGNSTTSQAYYYLDLTPVLGINYYRLKQVDKDGRSTTFKTLAVNYGIQNEGMRLISSNDQQMLLGINTAKTQAGSIYVFGSDGKVLFQKNIMLSTGQNQVSLPVSISSGRLGFVTLKTADGLNTIKVLR